MSCGAKWLVLWSLWLARVVRQPTLEVVVSGGRLHGGIANDGTHAYYLSIPYATSRRFEAPGPEPTWNGVLDATDEHIRCYQRYTSTTIAGQEDCLVLNVYTPLGTLKNPRPVMVFIHGGGFRDGSGSPLLYGPEYFTKHGVIIVTFNYRLEILGFLCLGIKEVSGNAGLKDQVAAFKWVRRNIAKFGGDPENVTIFGESAGSASVLFHLLSPMSKGLFHRAIMQSGSAMSPWSLQFEPLKTAISFAKIMGYNTVEPYELRRIFMNKTATELLRTRIPRADGDIVLSENIFVPCIEKKIFGIEQFLPDSPYNLLSKGNYNKVPVIIGFNSAEGLMFVGKENDTSIAKLDIFKALPRDLNFPTIGERINTAKKLKQLYMGDEEISKDNLVKFSRFEGDIGITFPTIITTDILLRSNNKPIYTYKFSYDGWLNLAKLYFGFRRVSGATHADELFYMFKTKIPLFGTFFEMKIIDMMTCMWSNFAKHGDPTPEVTSILPTRWRYTDTRDPRLLVIDENFSTEPLWNDDNIKFWNITYTKYRRKR